MRSEFFPLLACVFLLLNNGLAKAADGAGVKLPAASAEPRQYIHCLLGTVLDEAGQPVVGASVYVKQAEMVRKENRGRSWPTDRQGRFAITGLAPGTVTLGVVTPGIYKRDEFAVNTDCIDFTARLRRVEHAGAEYRVTATDEAGRPVAGARVRLLAQAASQDQQLRITTETRTNAQGVAVIRIKPNLKNLYNGIGHLVFDEEGYDLAIKFIALVRDEDVKFIIRKSGQHWRGRVVDLKGAPLAGARVRVSTWAGAGNIHSAGLPSIGLLDYSFLTDRDGKFEMERFSVKDRVTAEISLPLHCPIEARFSPDQECYTFGEKPPRLLTEQEQMTRKFEGVFRLAPGGDIRGRVIDKKTGRPFTQGGRIDVEGILPRIQTRAPITRWTRVAADGRFSFEGLRPFAEAFALDKLTAAERAQIQPADLGWRLRYTAGEIDSGNRKYVWAIPVRLDLEAGETKTVTVEVEEGVRVHGRLLNAKTGKTITKLMIAHFKSATTLFECYLGIEPQSQTGDWETFLPPGKFTMEFYPGKIGRHQSFDLTVRQGESCEAGLYQVVQE